MLLLGFFPSTRGAETASEPQPPSRTLRGEVRLVPPGRPFENADLIVTVEDVAAVDAPSRLIGRYRQRRVSYDGRPGTVLRFTMKELRPGPRSDCRVRVLVDVDHNGRISIGDYRTTKATPVFAGNDPDPLVVEAELKQE
jgi:hypothetical protein